jgi:hypothetical protein
MKTRVVTNTIHRAGFTSPASERLFSVARLCRDEETQRLAWTVLCLVAGVVAGATFGLVVGRWFDAVVGSIIGLAPGATLAEVQNMGIVSRRDLYRIVTPILTVSVLAGLEFLACRLSWDLISILMDI